MIGQRAGDEMVFLEGSLPSFPFRGCHGARPDWWAAGALAGVEYDSQVDVLHVLIGEPVPYEGDGLPGGIELDYSLNDGMPCGAKVIGLKKYNWIVRLGDLATLLSRHLGVDTTLLAHRIEQKTMEKRDHE